jgi:transcriptional regulator with XRE-family HTH domain
MAPSPKGTSLGRKVRTLRKARGLTQVQLAKKLGITQPSLSEIETGETKEVSGTVLAALCRVLRSMPDYFVLDEVGDTDFGEMGLAQQEAVYLIGHMKGETREAALKSLRGMAGAPLADPFNGQKPKAEAPVREGRSKREFLLGTRPATVKKKAKREA